MTTQDPLIQFIAKVSDRISDGMAIAITMASVAAGIVISLMI